MKTQSRAVLFALMAILAWSSVAVAFKTGLHYFHFIHFLFVSISVALLIFTVTLTIQKKWKLIFKIKRVDLLWAVIGGILNPFLYYLILFKAYSLLPAQMAQSLNYAWPVALVILSAPVLHQKLNAKSMLSLLIGFSGVYFIASQGQPWPLKPSNPFGVALAIGSSVIWASYWLINTRSTIDPVINLFINFSTAWVLTVLNLIFIPLNYPVCSTGWLAAIYSGIFEMGITFIVWLTAMRLVHRTDQIANLVFLAPFISLIFIHFILKETIYQTTVIGLVLIVSSIFINQYLKRFN